MARQRLCRAGVLLPLALVLIAASRAAAQASAPTAAYFVGSSQLSVTLSNNVALSSSVTNGDCRPAFAYYGRDNNTKGGAAPFSNCSVSGARVTLTLAAGVSYAGGDQVNIRVNQSVLLDAGNTSVRLQPLASLLPVLPVLTSATLTAPGVLSVKLPFATPGGFAMNASICASTFEIRGPGAAAAKPEPFASCTFSSDTATLTLKGPSLLEQGDTVNIVDGQTNLVYDTAPYARSAVGLAVAPTIYSVSLTSATTVTIGTAAPVAPLEDGACNAVFELRLSNGTVPAAPFSGCVVAADKMSVIATFANGTSFAGGMRINVRGNQTALKAFSATGPLFTALSTGLTIQPTILGATLTSATTIQVTLPVASTAGGTLDQAACNAIFELRGVGLSAAKSSPFESCTIAANGLSMTLTLFSSSYTAGDVLNVKSGQSSLVVGTTAYVPRAVPVLPTLVAAFLVSASTIHVQLPVASVLPAAFTPADCARTFLILPFNVTSPASAKPIASCSLTTDRTMVAVTLAPSAAFAAGDTINVVANQWQLRGGRSVTLGPAYVPAPRAAISITPVFSSAVLVSDASIVVTLPVPSTLAAGTDCNAAFFLLPSSGNTENAKSSPFASCRLDATNTTLTFNLTSASSYSVGDIITPQSSNNRLTVGTVSYGFRTTTINPTLTSATSAVLTSSDTVRVTLPFYGRFTNYNGNLNASICNAAFDLLSASNTSKSSPFSDCDDTSTFDSSSQTYTYYVILTLASQSTYTAGDSLNIRPNNAFFTGGSGAMYVPGPRNVAIRPTITAATMVDGSSLYVTLSAPAKAFNASVCNSMLEIGSNDLFNNCTLSADGRAITFGLKTADTVSAGTSVNIKADQQVLVAAGSGANDSPALVPLTTAISVTRAELTSAYLTSSTTIIGRLSVRAASSSGFQSSCNSVFTMARANGTARGDPFATCELSDDGLDVTLTLSSSVFESGDTLNMAPGQSLLSALTTDSGPKYLNRTSPVTIRPVLLSATAVGTRKVVVRLPLSSELSTTSCGSAISITGSNTAKTVTSCELPANSTTLTLTLDTNYASSDRIDISSLSQSIIRIVHPSSAGQGTTYGPKDSLPILPSVGDTYTTAANTLSVTLPAFTTTTPSPLTAEACNSAVGIFSSSGDSANSGAIASCSVSGSAMTITLSSTYSAGDRINVLPLPEDADNVLSAGSRGYTPLATPATIKPTIISAKATSATTLLVSLPVASSFLASDGTTQPLFLDKAACDQVLAVSSATLAATKSCEFNYNANPTFRTLRVTLDASTQYTPGQTISVASGSTPRASMLAGSGKTGPAYQPYGSGITIDPSYVASAEATAADTIVVKLPFPSGVYSKSGAPITGTLTGAQCSEFADVKSKAIASCILVTPVLTIKLMGNGTDVYAAGDTFNFKDTATDAVLRAGSSSSAPAYKSLTEALVITPLITKAVLTQGDTIVVTLPAANSIFNVSGAPTTTLTNTQCLTALSFFDSSNGAKVNYALKAGAGACTISGNQLTIKLETGAYTAGDQLNVITATNGQKVFRAGTDANGPLYGVASGNIKISVGYVTSAIARPANNKVELAFPFDTNSGGLATASWSTASACNDIVEVLALGVEGSPRAVASCALANNVLTVTLAAEEPYAPGDTIRLKAGQTQLRVSGSNEPHTPAATATPVTAGWLVSAVALNSTQISINLPVNCSFTKTSITFTECGTILTIGGSPTIGSCVLSNPPSSLIVTFSSTSTYTPGTTTVQFKSDQKLLVVGTSGTGAPFAPLSPSAASVVPGYITSAISNADNSVKVTVPYLISNDAAISPCSDALEVKPASGAARTISTCAISSSASNTDYDTVTVVLNGNEKLAPGDTLVIKASQGGVKTSTGSLNYAATSMAILPGWLSTGAATAIANNALMVTLPYPSTLSASAVCKEVVSVKNGVNDKTSGGCTLALDDTKTFLSITLTTGTLASGDTVNFLPTQTGLAAVSTSATSLTYRPLATARPVLKTPYDATAFSAWAVSSTQVELQLPMASALTSSTLSKADCDTIVTISGNRALASDASCSLTGTNKDVLVVNLAAALADGVTIALAGGTALRAGSASGTKYGAVPVVAGISIKPTVASAVMSAPDTILVSLPIASNTITTAGVPTCTGGTIEGCGNGGTTLATCATGVPLCNDAPATCTGGGSPTCQKSPAADCDDIFTLLTAPGSGFTCVNPSGAVATLKTTDNTEEFAVGTTVDVSSAQAGSNVNIFLHAGSTVAASKYVQRRGGAITVRPTIASAYLTGPVTITVPLPFAASLAGPTDCNTVVGLYSGITTTARGSPFASCSLSGDGKTLTLTLRSDSGYQPKDTVNILPTNSLLVAEGSTVAYGAHPSGVVVLPRVMSAVATGPRTIIVQLPATGSTTESASGWACGNTHLMVTAGANGAARAVTGNPCKLLGNILEYTISADFVSGDTFVMTGDVALFSDSGNSGNTLRYATLAPIPIYDQRAGTTPAKGNSIVSAKLISSTTVEMQLATAATITGSPADCAAYIAYSNTKLSGKCSLDATSTLLTATLGTAYANIDTVNVKAGQNLEFVKDGSQGATTPRQSFVSQIAGTDVAATIESAYTVTDKVIKVVLPTASAFWDATASGATTGSLSATQCNSVLLWMAMNDATLANTKTGTNSATCALTAGQKEITVTLSGASYVAGDTIQVGANNEDLSLRAASGTPAGTDPRYVARRQPLVITPRLVSAVAIGTTRVQVTLPVASKFFDASGAEVASPLTSTQCSSVLSVLSAGSSPTARQMNATGACSLDVAGKVLTVTLSDSYAPGDTINIAHTGSVYLKAGTTSAGPVYGATPGGVPISIAFVKSVIGLDSTTVRVELPFASAIMSTGNSPAVVTTLTKAICDSIFRIGSKSLASSADACKFDDTGKVLTLKLAGTSSNVFESGDKLDFSQAAGHVLRADASAAANVVASSTPYYQAPAVSLTGYEVIISPTIVAAAATGPSTVQLRLPFASAMTGVNSDTIAKADCAKVVSFDPAKEILDAADACVYSTVSNVPVLTVKLSGSADIGVFSAGNNVNIADANDDDDTTTKPLVGDNSGPKYVPAPAALTIAPTVYTATAVSTSEIHIGLPTASSLPEVTDAQCAAIVAIGADLTSPRSIKSCALDTDKMTLIVKLLDDAVANRYADGDVVNFKTVAQDAPALTVGTDGKGAAYVPSLANVPVQPSIVSAKATSARAIQVTLPTASSIFDTSNVVSAALTAAECAKVLTIKSSAGVARALDPTSACSVTSQTVTITLAVSEAFAAGDTINIADTNAATDSTAAAKSLRAGTVTPTRKYVPRKAAVAIAAAYIEAAFALSPTTVAVQLPVTSNMASTSTAEDCTKVVNVYSLDGSSNEVSKTVTACSVAQLSGTYFLMVTTTESYSSGDRVIIRATNGGATAPLRTGTGATGIPHEASNSFKFILPNINTAVLVDASTIQISFPGSISISGLSSSNSKPTCDAAFVFGNGEGNRTSPIQSCTTTSNAVVITIDPENPYQAGDWVNIRPDQNILSVSSAVAVNMPHNTIINPRPYGASATLTSPTSIAVPLPATSSVTDSSAAACNSALAIASVGAGTPTSAGPIASCSIANDRILNVNLATASYLAGDTINVASPTQSVLLYGVPPSAAPYFPAAEPIPILTTIDRATLINPTTVVLSLPAASAVPANLTVDDCMRAIAVSSTSGEAKNGSVASCTLSPDRMSLTVALKDAASYAPSDKVNVRQGQAELRVAAMDVGTGYVPKALDQVINPALFAAKPAVLSAPTTITATLPFSSALKAGACPVVLSPGAKAAASCALAADGVTLTLTLGEARYTAGDVLQVPSNQSGLTLADGTTLYVPSAAGIPIVPAPMSATRISADTISVTLPTTTVVVASTSDACSATVSIASASGAEYNAPVATCAVDASGTTLALTLAANYAPATGDTLNIKDGQTNLRAGSASGPAYIPAAERLAVAFPSPPPPSPSPPPPPAPTVTDLPARGLSSGYLECSAAVSSSVSNTASNVATDKGSFTVKLENNVDTVRFRDATCRDSYTGATVLDSTVSSHVLYGMDGLVVSPATGLARAASPPTVAATTFAGMVTTVLKNLGLPVEKYTTPLHKYDYYQTTFVNASVSGAAVANLQGMISSNVKLFASWLDGLNATTLGKDLTASDAVPVAQLSVASALLNSTTDLTRNTTVLALLRSAYTAVTGSAAPAARRRQLLQAPFSSVEGSAAALSQAVAESNKIIADQQAIVLRALTTGQPLSEAELRAAIAAATQAITMQSTTLASAAQALANGTLSVEQFKSEYTGDALLRRIAETRVPGDTGAPGGGGQPQADDDKKDNKALIIGLVVGLVGGAIVIGVIIAVVVARRRKQQIVANKGPAGAGEV